jgi:hypothetical protein
MTRASGRKAHSHRAGVILYAVSTGRIPSFYTSNDNAIADIRRCASNFSST